MGAFFNWLDERLDYRRHVAAFRRRVLPNGPGWWYTSASCVMWLLIIECVTGLLLMSTYSPSIASAWASVNLIDQSSAGRFLRGIHHYTSHALVILLGLHLLRVLITGAYRVPRELVWITGLLLFPLVLVWTVTGNPLAASQKGLAQIQVEGNILAGMPVAGPWLQRILFGGPDVGNLTLTRLYFLHVGLLPFAVGILFAVHLHQVIKHSPYRQTGVEPDSNPLLPYWPYQSIRNVTVLSCVFTVIAVISSAWGAPLPAPADAELPFSPRPEWYFRWLFELRRYFSGETEFIATMVVPGLLLSLLMVVPFLDRVLPRRLDRICRIMIVAGCMTGWGWLTLVSFRTDWNDQEYMASVAHFEELSKRARLLAQTEPIPATGAIELLRNDPLTQGPKIFARNCSSCHEMKDNSGVGIATAEPSAPNLFGFATASWVAGMLDVDRISHDDYFGRSAFRDGDMKQHLKSLLEEFKPDDLKIKLQHAGIALAAEAGHQSYDSPEAKQGRELIVGELRCVECHQFGKDGSTGAAPTLTGYGSAEWLKGIISNPRAEQFYGDRNDRMPSFAVDPHHPDLNLLTSLEIDLLVKWLRAPNILPLPAALSNEKPAQTSFIPKQITTIAVQDAP